MALALTLQQCLYGEQLLKKLMLLNEPGNYHPKNVYFSLSQTQPIRVGLHQPKPHPV